MEYKQRLMLKFVWESKEAANDSTKTNKMKQKKDIKETSNLNIIEVKLSSLVILEALCSDNLSERLFLFQIFPLY